MYIHIYIYKYNNICGLAARSPDGWLCVVYGVRGIPDIENARSGKMDMDPGALNTEQ